jgi:hypothetical protein
MHFPPTLLRSLVLEEHQLPTVSVEEHRPKKTYYNQSYYASYFLDLSLVEYSFPSLFRIVSYPIQPY